MYKVNTTGLVCDAEKQPLLIYSIIVMTVVMCGL